MNEYVINTANMEVDRKHEIVRCRDCKHLLYDTCLLLSHELEGRYDCPHSDRDLDVKPEDFCAWGERLES